MRTIFLLSIWIVSSSFAAPLAFANEDSVAEPQRRSVSKLVRAFLITQPFYVSSSAPDELQRPTSINKLKGWDFVFSQLEQEGIEREYLLDIFSDPRMPMRETVYFKLKPRESSAIYRDRLQSVEFRNALSFYQKNYPYFERANLLFGVPEEVLLAILQIETRCGGYTGGFSIFERLARLASIVEPTNVEETYKRLQKEFKGSTIDDFQARAQWLYQEFFPHLVASLILARDQGLHPLDIKGSPAGAYGLPQFLPGNVFMYGVDGDHNGKIDLFTAPDAIYSIANFLVNHGWNEQNPALEERRLVIWHYNRSESYINTVLEFAEKIKPRIAKFKSTLPKTTFVSLENDPKPYGPNLQGKQ